MNNMKGNLRSPAKISHSNSDMLPSARIRCGAGRIQVGDRAYHSASDALSAYLQQFDGKQNGGTQISSCLKNTSLDNLIRKSDQDRISSAGRCRRDAANVTGLLVGGPRPDGKSETSFNGLSPVQSPGPHKGGSPARQGAKLSVSFALPDSDDSQQQHSQQSANLSGSLTLVSSNPQKHSETAIRNKQHNSSSSGNISQTNTSSFVGISKLDSTNKSVLHNSGTASAKASKFSPSPGPNGLVKTGLPVTNGITTGQNKEVGGWQGILKSSGSSQGDKHRAKSEVEMLLTDIPLGSELKAMKQNSQGEEKLKNMLKETSTPESSSDSSNKSTLQQEVEEALSRSAQLLENIKTDVLVSPRCVSDIGSLNTDILLSINPENPAEALRTTTGRESRSRHRYSYHTPAHHPRSLSVDPMPSVLEQRSLYKSGRRRSVDSLGPQSSVLGSSIMQDLNSSMSALSDSEDILKRLSSVGGPSFSESTGNRLRETNLRGAGQTGPPSWIQELLPPAQSNGVNRKGLADSVFSVSGGCKVPSWVNGLEQSDIVSSVDTQALQDATENVLGGAKTTAVSDLAKSDSLISALSYAGPGLNYSDLLASPVLSKQKDFHGKTAAKLSRNNSFSGVGSKPGLRRDIDRSKPPVTMSQIYQDLAGVDMTRPKSHNMVANLSSSLGPESDASILRKKVCEDSVGAKKSLDRYLSQLNDEAEAGKKSDNELLAQKISGLPRCSSMDLLNRVGGHGSVPSDITGASPISKDSNFSSKLFLEDPTLTPVSHRTTKPVASAGLRQGARNEQSLDGDQDLLDGDRPWEAMLPSFKAPVQVGISSPETALTGTCSQTRPETPTFSGGQQPGSMEALKQMIFRLQNEESSAERLSVAAAATLPRENGDSRLIPSLKDYDFEAEPGGQSLERALHHLGRLKTLVQTGTSPSQQESTASSQPQEHNP